MWVHVLDYTKCMEEGVRRTITHQCRHLSEFGSGDFHIIDLDDGSKQLGKISMRIADGECSTYLSICLGVPHHRHIGGICDLLVMAGSRVVAGEW